MPSCLVWDSCRLHLVFQHSFSGLWRNSNNISLFVAPYLAKSGDLSRNMGFFLKSFTSATFSLKPCPHSKGKAGCFFLLDIMAMVNKYLPVCQNKHISKNILTARFLIATKSEFTLQSLLLQRVFTPGVPFLRTARQKVCINYHLAVDVRIG